jgi:hypothetical protein
LLDLWTSLPLYVAVTVTTAATEDEYVTLHELDEAVCADNVQLELVVALVVAL